MKFRRQFENFLMYADLARQHKQNEEIRKSCESQRKTMALQQAAMELQRDSGQTRSQERNPPLAATNP